MTLQPNLFGENLSQGPLQEEIRRLIEKYPAILENRSSLYWFFIKERCPWIMQMEESKRNEMKAACMSIESVRRRSQEFKADSLPSSH